jgi:prepilin-type N-terminal cleavage/methylation domain-containing protein
MKLLIRSFRRLRDGFTLIELLTVMAVIAILAGLILSVSGYATKKGALARAETEIKALEAALESYKTDNGTYPHQPMATSGTIQYLPNTGGTQSYPPSDTLDPRTNGNSQYNNSSYANATIELYEALTGDLSLSGTGGGAGVTNYIRDMRQDVYGRYYSNVPISGTNTVLYLSDPFGNCYGYSTANATAVSTGTSPVPGYPTTTAPLPGYNSTYDLWCTGGQVQTPYNGGTGSSTAPGAPGDPMLQWIKNW